MLIYENMVSSDFAAKVKQISDRLDIDPNWLMAVMKKESNLDPAAINHYSGAVGLIQFLPSTLQSQFGKTQAEMRALNAIQQLGYVERYLLPYRNRITSYTDTYLAVFYPVAIGESDEYRFPQNVYAGNSNMDIDQDGILTIKDVRNWLMQGIPEGWEKALKKRRSVGNKFIRRNWLWILTISIFIMLLTYYLLNHFLK